MKTTSCEQSRGPRNIGEEGSGFSLVELMIVIAIVGVLTAIVVAEMPAIQRAVKRSACEALVEELGASIDRYALDNGIPPQNLVTNPPEDGAHILYRELSGDRNLDGLPDSGVEIYNENLKAPQAAGNRKGERVDYDGQGRLVIVDPFGSLIRYHADPPGRTPIRTRNPDYDLWSLGGAEPGSTDPEDVANWKTNWTD